MKLEHFDVRYETLLRYGLAEFLKIEPDDVCVKAKEKGSVRITIELPTESAEELLRAYNKGNLLLIKALSPMKLLDISAVTEQSAKEDKIDVAQDHVLGERVRSKDTSAFEKTLSKQQEKINQFENERLETKYRRVREDGVMVPSGWDAHLRIREVL